jgi:hypothetical protein
MENLAVQKFPLFLTADIAFILLLTVGLAYGSGGNYVDMLLTLTMVIFLITIVLKVLLMSAENNHE